jgi:copper chaperone
MQVPEAQRTELTMTIEQGDEMADLSFRVPQMNCGHCVKNLTRTLRAVEGIAGVEVDLHTKWVVVTGDHIDSEAIRRAVSDAGYEPEL